MRKGNEFLKCAVFAEEVKRGVYSLSPASCTSELPMMLGGPHKDSRPTGLGMTHLCGGWGTVGSHQGNALHPLQGSAVFLDLFLNQVGALSLTAFEPSGQASLILAASLRPSWEESDKDLTEEA